MCLPHLDFKPKLYFKKIVLCSLRIMSLPTITCSSYIDYSARRNCPIYNIDRCPTPDTPILCPMIDNEPRSPCTRFICSTETQFSPDVVTSRTTSTTAKIMSSVINSLIESGSSASLQLQDAQVNYLFVF